LGWITRENGLAALFFSQVCLAVHRDEHRFFERMKFLKTNEIFHEKCVVQKKTKNGRWKLIVQKNEKIIVFIKTKKIDLKSVEQT